MRGGLCRMRQCRYHEERYYSRQSIDHTIVLGARFMLVGNLILLRVSLDCLAETILEVEFPHHNGQFYDNSLGN